MPMLLMLLIFCPCRISIYQEMPVPTIDMGFLYLVLSLIANVACRNPFVTVLSLTV